MIQMAFIDTWAATGAGAFSLTENGLYTTDSWKIFLSRLNKRGVFSVSRWHSRRQLDETGRLISLAVAALLERGIADPAKHLFMIADARERKATLLTSPDGFSDADIGALEKIAAKMDFEIVLHPKIGVQSTLLQRISHAKSKSELVALNLTVDLDLSPPDDERPFFFNQLPFRSLTKMRGILQKDRYPGVVTGNIGATITLAMLFAISCLLVILAIIRPMKYAINSANPMLVAFGSAYFGIIGSGFMMTEIGLLQKFSVFLGNPIYSLSIVLFSLILTTGIGSFFSESVSAYRSNLIRAIPVLTGLYLIVLGLFLGPFLLEQEGSPLVIRAIISTIVISPAGLLMGFAFPLGLRLVRSLNEDVGPWFWGINGAFGVLASVAAVVCSITFGIGVTICIAGVLYCLLPIPILILQKSRGAGLALRAG